LVSGFEFLVSGQEKQMENPKPKTRNPKTDKLPSLQHEDHMENLTFLFAAYTAVWALLFVYVVVLSRRNRALEREIEELRQLLQRARKS
jgi:CcmD family protein